LIALLFEKRREKELGVHLHRPFACVSTGPETYTADKGMFVEQTHMATTLSFIS